jgi:hypothetical protein
MKWPAQEDCALPRSLTEFFMSATCEKDAFECMGSVRCHETHFTSLQCSRSETNATKRRGRRGGGRDLGLELGEE